MQVLFQYIQSAKCVVTICPFQNFSEVHLPGYLIFPTSTLQTPPNIVFVRSILSGVFFLTVRCTKLNVHTLISPQWIKTKSVKLQRRHKGEIVLKTEL